MPIHVTTTTVQSLSNKTFVDRLSTTNVVFASSGNSDNWSSVYSTVQANSATTWNYQGTDIKSLTGNWQNTYSTVNSISSNWSSVYSSFNSQSASNASVFSTVNANSATWGVGGSTTDTGVRALTSNWQSTYLTVSALSASWKTESDSLWVGAGAMVPNTLSGASAVTMPITANGNEIYIDSMQFDAASNKFTQFNVALPAYAVRTSLAATFTWTTVTSAATGDCVWSIQGRSIGDGSSIDAGWGNVVQVTDSIAGNTTLQISPSSSIISLSGSITNNSMLQFRVYRDAAAAGDTLAVNAALYGITLYYTI